MQTSVRVLLARFRATLRPEGDDHELEEELRAHLQLAVDEKFRRGIPEPEARRLARLELGNLLQIREDAARLRGFPWLSGLGLDLELALRRLRKSWGLTVVAGLAMTVVITLAALAFEVLAVFDGGSLPFEGGDRVVALHAVDPATGDALGTSEADVLRWRETLRSVSDLGAFRTVDRNLQIGVESAGFEPGRAVEVAEMSAVGFALTGTAPRFGRPLLAADEGVDAEPVLVLGDRSWRTSFGADPDVVGRRVRLDGVVHTVVGVMPAGFGFPVAHDLWVPLRLGARPTVEPAGSRSADLFVFGRLADGATLARAETELRRVGLLPKAASPGPVGDAALRLRVVPYASAFFSDVDGWTGGVVVLLAVLLLLPPAVNVAILVYARTIARQEEFAARFVLGASRARIVAQLFVEVLVLATGSGLLALGLARATVGRLVAERVGRGELPFWMESDLSFRTVGVVGVLVVLAAFVAGAIPALRATGERVQAGFKSLGAAPPQARLGAVWTGLIVAQVAVATALLPISAEMVWGTVRSGFLGPGFAAGDVLTARLGTGEAVADLGDRSGFARSRDEVRRRLEARAGVAGVAFAESVPGDEPWLRIEAVEAVEAGSGNESTFAGGDEEDPGLVVGSSRVARSARVEEAFFHVLDLPLLAGRLPQPSDLAPASRTLIVNRSFAEHVLGGGDVVGRRIRYRARETEALPAGRSDEAYEIVGVVGDLHCHSTSQAVFHPSRVDAVSELALVARLRTDASTVAGFLRSDAWAVDPSLRLEEVRTMAAIYRDREVGNWIGAGTLVVATSALLLLSAAGIAALMSFVVGRRRREIGIRTALGASPERILAAVFGRALRQVALGVGVGAACAAAVGRAIPIAEIGGHEIPGVVPAAALALAVVAFLALLEPAHRGLRVDPVEELREG